MYYYYMAKRKLIVKQSQWQRPALTIVELDFPLFFWSIDIIEVTDIGLQLYRIGRNIKAHSKKTIKEQVIDTFSLD